MNHYTDFNSKYHYLTGTHCWYCKRAFGEVSLINSSIEKIFRTKEHIIPISRRGRNNIVNYIGSCNECNTVKSDRMPIEFAFYIECLNFKQPRHKMQHLFKTIIFQCWKLHNKTNKKLVELDKPQFWIF